MGRIGEQQASGFVYHLGDALGSVRQLVDVNGVVQLTRSYEPYGTALSTTGNASSVFGYTGEQLDGSGLQFNRARYYASGTGRFVSRDSWSGNEDNPLSYNKYLYVLANPINLIDPSGLAPMDDFCTGTTGRV
jgi:RHS repeat-associated protein